MVYTRRPYLYIHRDMLVIKVSLFKFALLHVVMSIFFRHTVFWFCVYLIWSYLKSGGTVHTNILLATIANIFVYMFVYYLLRHILLNKLYRQSRFVEFSGAFVVLFSLIYIIWRGIDYLCIMEIQGGTYFLDTVQSFVPAMALLSIELYSEQRNEYDRHQLLEKEKLTSELKLLKSQINPQFLLDTLNNLYKNVINKSPVAPEIIMRLSEVLDHVLYKSQKETVPLLDEVRAIRNFIELEKIRYKNSLDVEFIHPEVLLLDVSPLLLLDIVQNIFRGIDEHEKQITILIKIYEIDDVIHCHIRSSSIVQGEIETKIVDDIDRQLNLIYPDRHELKIDREDKAINVILAIKLNR